MNNVRIINSSIATTVSITSEEAETLFWIQGVKARRVPNTWASLLWLITSVTVFYYVNLHFHKGNMYTVKVLCVNIISHLDKQAQQRIPACCINTILFLLGAFDTRVNTYKAAGGLTEYSQQKFRILNSFDHLCLFCGRTGIGYFRMNIE